MNSTLIVYIVSGSAKLFKWQCKNSIQTLIDHGKYNGKIIILTDNSLDWSDFNTFPNCEIMKVLDNKSAYIHRLYIDTYIDLSKYSHMLYMDTDTLIVKNICPLFETNKVLFSEEYHIIKNLEKKSKCHTFFMNDDEYESYKELHAINGGQFVIPNHICDVFFKTWRQINGQCNGWGYDQASLNSLIRRNMFESENSKYIQLFSESIKENSILCHYVCCTQLKNRFLVYKTFCEKFVSNFSFDSSLLHNIELK